MSTHAIFRPPPATNEPVHDFARGSDERARLKARLEQMRTERPEVPLVIGGRDVTTGDLRPAVMPHDKEHVLAEVHQGGAEHVQQAIDAAAAAWEEWSRWPWEDRAAVFLRAAELLSGPWRETLLAATMLGQSKTVHQAEIDAAAESIDFFRFNVRFRTRIYEEQPVPSPGVWNRLEYRPLEGFVFAVSPFNFTAIAANLTSSPALMGNTVVWKPAGTAMLSAYYLMRLFQEAGLPDGVINLVYGGGATIGDAALASPHLAGIHFTGSTPVFNGMWRTVASNMERYRNYPRIVGETGGKDFIVAHPSADVQSLATAIVRGSFETQREAIEEAKHHAGTEIVVGGGYDDSHGFFVDPTVIETTDPDFRLMREEIFGPVVTTYVYDERKWDDTLGLIDRTAPYGLTGAVFSADRSAAAEAAERLRYTAGNFYVNDKPTGAVVGQQPFGGSRSSGTNDKAGSMWNLIRWVSPRTIKETYIPPKDYRYPFLASD